MIQELQRRRNLEEKLRWDFMSLDKNGNNRLPVADALILFKLTHGDGMSIGKWRKFLASREDPQMDVYWDEIKVMLCDHPDQGSNEEEYQEESDRLDKAKQQETIDDFEAYQINQVCSATRSALSSLYSLLGCFSCLENLNGFPG